MGLSPLSRVISIVTRLITLLISTHEPPSRGSGLGGLGFRVSARGFNLGLLLEEYSHRSQTFRSWSGSFGFIRVRLNPKPHLGPDFTGSTC